MKLKILLLFLFFSVKISFSQQFSHLQIKTALIYKFAENIEWQNEDLLDSFNIAVFGADTTILPYFRQLTKKNVKSKPITVKRILTLAELISPYPQIIYIPFSEYSEVKDIFHKIADENVLLVSDNFKDHEHMMLNFIPTGENEITFEINKITIENQNLKILPKLLLLGGTEIEDIKDLYIKQEEELIEVKDKLELQIELLQNQETKITEQNLLISKKEEEINNQQLTINEQLSEILKQKNNLDDVLLEVEKQKESLEEQKLLAEFQKKITDEQKILMEEQNKNVEEKNQILLDLNKKIEISENQILEQKNVLNQKDSRIEKQQNILFFLIFFVSVILAFGFVLYRNYKIKQRINNQLIEKNIKIEHQKDELEKTYKELSRNEQKLTAIFESANEGIGLFDRKGNFTYVNSSLCSIFGYEIDEILKMNYFNLLAEVNQSNLEKFNKMVNGEIEVISADNLYIRRDRTEIWGKLSAKCLRHSDGEFDEIVGIFTDIDKIKRSEEKVKQLYNNIQQLSEIGKEITSYLKIDDIIETAYKYLNQLIDAKIFAIGLHNPSENKLDFFGKSNEKVSIEKSSDNLENENLLSVKCFKNKKRIIISNESNEIIKPVYDNKFVEQIPLSLIYLPLILKGNIIGVVTVQSYTPKAYNENSVNILRNIAVYTSIALENGNIFHRIEEQKREIEKVHNKIKASITYAKRIQYAVLPSFELNPIQISSHFIIYYPRDIISGDFYWFKAIGKFYAFVAADCTGHGVPGAFMSILGISILNEIVTTRNIKMPAQVLTEMRHYIKKTMQQSGHKLEAQDGMDIAFCAINLETLEMTFAGANNPCWIFRNDELRVMSDELKENEQTETHNSSLKTHHSKLITLEADRQPIGIYLRETPFSEHKFQLRKDDIFYIFSDGYYSQFGGEKGEKFKMRRFRETLSEMCCLSLTDQKQILEEKFNDWKGTNEQTDDVLVVGVKI